MCRCESVCVCFKCSYKSHTWSYPSQGKTLLSEAIGYQTKSTMTGIVYLPLGNKVTRSEVSRIPAKQDKLLPVFLVAHQRSYHWGQYILWSHGEIKLVLTRKLPPWWPVFIVPEAAGRERSPIVSPRYESCELQLWLSWQDKSMGSKMAWVLCGYLWYCSIAYSFRGESPWPSWQQIGRNGIGAAVESLWRDLQVGSRERESQCS